MNSKATTEAPSERFINLHRDVRYALYEDSVDAVVEKLESILQATDGLTAQEYAYFEDMLLTYRRAADVDFQPPHPNHSLEVFPLSLRYYEDCIDQPEKAERTLWTYIQHCPFGTAVFHDAVEMLVEYAMRRENLPLARHAAQLLLHHYAILNLLRFNPCTLVTYDIDADQASNENIFPLSLPYWEAVAAMKTDDAPCWAEMLEITLENATPDSRKEVYYPKVLAALRDHYRKMNNFSRLEWIKAYEYE